MLDTGAQVSLIRTSTAKELGLKGTNVTITKVGGEEEQLDTKVYQVRIRSLENRSAHVVKVIGNPSVSTNASTVNFDEMAKVFGITKSKFWRNDSPVDVLIGIDNPLLYTGETRQRKSLIARHSPLGCVLFGTTPGRNEPAHHVFHIKTVTPPAVDMADFWSTESMGVTAKTCSCDSEKLNPIELQEAKANGKYPTRGKGIHLPCLTTEIKQKESSNQPNDDWQKTQSMHKRMTS